MESELLDLFRKWLSHRGLLGWAAAILFGFYVVIPVAIREEHSLVSSLAKGYEQAAQRTEQQQLTQLRRYDAEHHIRVTRLP